MEERLDRIIELLERLVDQTEPDDRAKRDRVAGKAAARERHARFDALKAARAATKPVDYSQVDEARKAALKAEFLPNDTRVPSRDDTAESAAAFRAYLHAANSGRQEPA